MWTTVTQRGANTDEATEFDGEGIWNEYSEANLGVQKTAESRGINKVGRFGSIKGRKQDTKRDSERKKLAEAMGKKKECKQDQRGW